MKIIAKVEVKRKIGSDKKKVNDGHRGAKCKHHKKCVSRNRMPPLFIIFPVKGTRIIYNNSI